MNAKRESLLIKNTVLVTGDGQTVVTKADIVVASGKIVYVGDERPAGVSFDLVIDGTDRLTLPGIVNLHAHGCVLHAPLFSSATKALTQRQVEANLRRHLAQGTTTLLNVDGFALPEDVSETAKLTPMRVRIGVTHYRTAYLAAKNVDGEGLIARGTADFDLNSERSLVVAAIGEAGSGATLGGGVQDYRYVPAMVKKETGRTISEAQARRLKEAILGREITPGRFSARAAKKVLAEIGLGNFSPRWAKAKIEETVLPGLNLSLDSFKEGAKLAQEYRVPFMVHTALPSSSQVEDLSKLGSLLVAGHVNHPSFEAEEAIKLARKLKKSGAFIDISTFNVLKSHQRDKELALFARFLEEGLADTISTDYGGGKHSAILEVLELVLAETAVSVPAAVAKFTTTPARAIPALAPTRGLIKEGYVADLIMVNRERISRVEAIIIGGEPISL